MRNFNTMKNMFGNTATKKGRYSMGVVNNRNGKRITVSASLGERLGIEDEVAFAIDTETNELLVAKDLPEGVAAKFNASGEDGQKKIVYSAGVVEKVTDVFGLDFSNKTSMSFTDITIEECAETGIPYAAVKMRNNVSGGGDSGEEDETEGVA